MGLLKDAVEEKKMDVRVVDKNLTRGVIVAKDLNQSLKGLSDDSANAEFVTLEQIKESEELNR